VRDTKLVIFGSPTAGTPVVVAAPRLIGPLVAVCGAPLGAAAWTDTAIVLPERLAGSYRNIYTQEHVTCDSAGELPLASVLNAFPAALLSRVTDASGYRHPEDNVASRASGSAAPREAE